MSGARLVFALLALAAAVAAQDAPTFRSGIALVHVDAEVLGKDGRVVTGLSKTDFRVFDDGAEQPLAAFSGEQQPLDLILLFDVSSSMRSAVEKVAAAAHGALLELRPGDRVAVMKFNTETRLVAPFSEDRRQVEEALDGLLKSRFGGGTCIQDAVYDAANRFIWFDGRSRRRRAVLIVTDNLGRSTRREMSVVENLWEADALLSGLVTSNHRSLGGLLAAKGAHLRGGIDRIVEKTGGDAIRSDDLGSAFPEMMHRIRSRYSLYYRLPEGEPSPVRGSEPSSMRGSVRGSVRAVRVELSADAQQRFPEARVVARQGYRASAYDGSGFARR